MSGGGGKVSGRDWAGALSAHRANRKEKRECIWLVLVNKHLGLSTGKG